MTSEIGYPYGGVLKHSLTLADRNGRPEVADERIEPSSNYADERVALSYFRPPLEDGIEAFLRMSSPNPTDPNAAGSQLVYVREGSLHFRSDWVPQISLVSFANPNDYPALWHLKEQYSRIRLFRDWSFGPSAEIRRNQSAHDRADFLDEGGTNLALVLSHFQGEDKRQVVTALRKLFDGIVDITFSVAGGNVALFLEEAGNLVIPATRLSDGTLRYLCMLAILLHPEPPPLVVIEEPELGLHPDLLPTLADLLVSASRAQSTDCDDSFRRLGGCAYRYARKRGGLRKARWTDRDEAA